MESLPSIRRAEDESRIEIVNQLLLPHVVQYIDIKSPEDAFDAIKTMKIRGAPAIASLAALSVSSHLTRALATSPPPAFLSSPTALQAYLLPILQHLNAARPTAVNLSAATRRLEKSLSSAIEDGADVREVARLVLEEGKKVADEDVQRNKEMGQHGAEWILKEVAAKNAPLDEGRVNVLTVCNTGSLATSGYGTALGVITRLHELGRLNKAYFTQSAPYHQGSRLTALELLTLKIPCVMICDSMVGSLFQNHNIHAVVVGADRIARNGDTANKIGTYNAAVLADRHSIPFLVAAPISTIDFDIPDGSHIPIEHRPALEATVVRGALYPRGREVEQAVVQITPDGLTGIGPAGIYNPSFDVTPASLIRGIVTELGVSAANGIRI